MKNPDVNCVKCHKPNSRIELEFGGEPVVLYLCPECGIVTDNPKSLKAAPVDLSGFSPNKQQRIDDANARLENMDKKNAEIRELETLMNSGEAPEPVVKIPVKTSVTEPELCDRCGAVKGQSRALVNVVKTPDSSLWFCGHHYDTFSEALTEQGWTVAEDRRVPVG